MSRSGPYGPYKRRTLADRFWPKVQKGDGCWLWTASRTSTGYGQINEGGFAGHPLKAHRVAYELTNGPIPANMDIRHRCNTPLCVRPDHLDIGTHAENMADVARGGYHAKRKLTVQQVHEIRRLWPIVRGQKPGGARLLARQFGIDRATIRRLLEGKTYHFD